MYVVQEMRSLALNILLPITHVLTVRLKYNIRHANTAQM